MAEHFRIENRLILSTLCASDHGGFSRSTSRGSHIREFVNERRTSSSLAPVVHIHRAPPTSRARGQRLQPPPHRRVDLVRTLDLQPVPRIHLDELDLGPVLRHERPRHGRDADRVTLRQTDEGGRADLLPLLRDLCDVRSHQRQARPMRLVEGRKGEAY